MRLREHIQRHEVGLWFRDGDFRAVLEPGTYRLWRRLVRPSGDRIHRVGDETGRFSPVSLDQLVREPALAPFLTVVELSAEQRALVWRKGRLDAILGPGRSVWWTRDVPIEVETFDVRDTADGRFEHPRLDTIVRHSDARDRLRVVDVANSVGLLRRNGRLVGRLEPGRHVFWRDVAQLDVTSLDLRRQVLDVAGQEILTRDSVTLRVTLVVTWRVEDPEMVVEAVADAEQAVYRAAQLALRSAVGTRELDAVLADKDAVGSEVAAEVRRTASAIGLEILEVGLRDIVLPGEMRQILNQVIEAEHQARADLVRRREETAAARAQANTAKLFADNPISLRLRELETLQAILAGSDVTLNVGSRGVGYELRRLVAADDDARSDRDTS